MLVSFNDVRTVQLRLSVANGTIFFVKFNPRASCNGPAPLSLSEVQAARSLCPNLSSVTGSLVCRSRASFNNCAAVFS